jgi:hypothetical protein
MKDNQDSLEAQLSPFFEVHLSRLKCLSALILCLVSMFRIGLDAIRCKLLNANPLNELIYVLSCT